MKAHLTDHKVFAATQQATLLAFAAAVPQAGGGAAAAAASRPAACGNKGLAFFGESSNNKGLVGRVGARLQQLIKLLLELGGALSYAKELRDLFVDFLEVVELLKLVGLTEAEASSLLEVLGSVYAPSALKPAHAECWVRFLDGARTCIALLYTI